MGCGTSSQVASYRLKLSATEDASVGTAAKFRKAEEGHLEAVKKERELWVPARDAAVSSTIIAPPRQPLDASLSDRLLTGWVSAGDAAAIRRLARSSIWLFSSSTFRASADVFPFIL